MSGGKILNLGVADPKQIVTGDRFRKDVDLDDEFLDSIREKGVITPVTINQDWTLVAGGRRLAAALKLNLAELPYVMRETDGELDLRECELIENACRKDLKWVDRTHLVDEIHKLMQEKHGKDLWGQQKTADMLNRSVGGINRQVKLAKALSQFPTLAECKTEDEAVKLYRKLGEALLVRALVKKGAGSNTPEPDNNFLIEKHDKTLSDEGTQPPVGVRLAAHATNHYRIGDALDGIQEIIDVGSSTNIRLVEVDPPYAIDLAEVKKGDSAGIEKYQEITKEVYPAFLHKLCTLLFKVTPDEVRVIFWFGQEWYEEVKNCLLEAGFQVDLIPCVWVKPGGQTASPDTYLARCYETFFVAWKGRPPIRKRGRSNVFSFNGVAAVKKRHPTERPIELIQDILTTFGWPGIVVMIPFMGSGNTARAAYTCGMLPFGWDISEGYKNPFLAQVQIDRELGVYDHIIGESLND